MMNDAEKIVAALLDGKVGDWLSNRWSDLKHAAGEFTGIGRDEFGMGKPEKGFKPKYGPMKPQPKRIAAHRPKTDSSGEKVWEID